MQPVKMTDTERAEWVAMRQAEGWTNATLDQAPRWKCRDAQGVWRFGVSEEAARIRAKNVCGTSS